METNQRHRCAVLLVVLALIVAGILAVWIFDPRSSLPEDFELSATKLTALIRSWGPWGIAGSISLMALHSIMPFPAEILAIANGMVYGPFWGGTITWIGAMLGAFIAFGLARTFGQSLVRRFVPDKHWHRVEAWSRREGGGTLLLSRLVPVIAFNLINYAAGLTQISWFTFSWATGIGILPLIVLLSVAGGSMGHLSWSTWLGFAGLGIVLWWLFHLLVKSHARHL